MLASLSIDLDGLEHYHRIHGLPPPPAGPDPVHERAVERFGDLAARLGVKGTAFCIGRSVEGERAAAALRALAAAGHEVGNHSLSHDYALSRRPPAEIAAEVRGGADAIARVTGARPLGFRAPGYALSPALLAALEADAYRYDSSAFPALPYYVAKAAVMAALAATGRRSGALLDRPGVLLAPRRPYLPAAHDPYARGRVPVVELPIATGAGGFPLTGTFLATLPAGAIRLLCAPTQRRPHFNLELHGLDLLDVSDAPSVLGPLSARQRDLLVPAAEKARRLEALARWLGREWVTLATAAERLRPTLG